MIYQPLQTLSLNIWTRVNKKMECFYWILHLIFLNQCVWTFFHISVLGYFVSSMGCESLNNLVWLFYWSRNTSVTWNQCPFVTTAFHLTFPLPIVTLFDYIAKHQSTSPSMFLARLSNPDFFVLKESLKSSSLPVDYATHCEVFKNVLTMPRKLLLFYFLKRYN